MAHPDLRGSPFKADLFGPPPGTYLNTAAESPLLRSVADNLLAYARDKGWGEPGREAHEQVLARARARVARWLGADPASIAFCYSASDALGWVATSLPWRPGDRVVVGRLEYPSVLWPWLPLQALGVAVDVVDVPPLRWGTEALLERIGPGTRLVAVSAVSYRTGVRVDLARLREAVHAQGGWLLADVTQALGAVPVQAAEADLMVASGYKWLMGVHGVAVLYVAPHLLAQLQPPYLGWRSGAAPAGAPAVRADGPTLTPVPHADARRFEAGMHGFAALYGLDAGMAHLEAIGLPAVWQRVAALAGHLWEGLARLELPLLTPAEPERRAGIVALWHPEAAAVVQALKGEGLLLHAPVPDVVRLSAHFFNDLDDVDRALALLAARARTWPRRCPS